MNPSNSSSSPSASSSHDQPGDRSSAPVALVTGSGRQRLGNVVARALAGRGYSLALHYHRSADSARETQRELTEQAATCEVFQADVSREDEVRRMCDAVWQRFARLDVLVTTSSIWETVTLEDTTADDLLRNFAVNTMGTFLCAQQAGLAMAEQEQGGAIITIGDWAIERPYLDHAAYFVSKGAIPTLTRALAVELAHRNPKVRVNCIHPGPVLFPPHTTPAEQQEMIDSTLVKEADCPAAIVQAVEFLIDNSFITGACIPIDGGRTIYAPDSTARARPI